MIDSERTPLIHCRKAIEEWADITYFEGLPNDDDWNSPPEIIFFSAEIPGGSAGKTFENLVEKTHAIPIVAISKVRSLAQAVGFFRAGAADYLTLPLDEDDAREALERAENWQSPRFMVELEPIDHDTGEISLSLTSVCEQHEENEERIPPTNDAISSLDDQIDGDDGDKDDDILAHLPPTPPPDENERKDYTPYAYTGEFINDATLHELETQAEILGENAASRMDCRDKTIIPHHHDLAPESKDEEEPVAVDGLPIPLLWDELPCGLLVFDSEANLVFANQPALELFGRQTMVELEDALENNRSSFNALANTQKPLPDNQWPHVLAAKTRTARSALVSIEKPDKRRLWLKIDCRPHLHGGEMSRLLFTAVNMTGDLPPVASAEPQTATSTKNYSAGRQKARNRKKGKK